MRTNFYIGILHLDTNFNYRSHEYIYLNHSLGDITRLWFRYKLEILSAIKVMAPNVYKVFLLLNFNLGLQNIKC